MTKRMQVYKCSLCGNIVEVVHAAGGILSCCGQPMELLDENTVDAAVEKHVPVVERTGAGATVKVGSVPHPMEPDHFIEWVELIAGDTIHRRYLKPGEAPEAAFEIGDAEAVARELCNLHGLWRS